MTALDDFVAEHDRPLRRVVLPDLLRARDRGRGGAARRAARSSRARSTGSRAARASTTLLELAENDPPRRDACSSTTSTSAARRSSSSGRDAGTSTLLKGALLDEHYLENELRLEHLLRLRRAGEPRRTADRSATRSRHDQADYRAPAARAAGSGAPGPTATPRPYFPYTAMGRIRLDHLERCLDVDAARRRRRRPGRVRHRPRRWRASSCAAYLEAHELADRHGLGRRSRSVPSPSRRTAPTLADDGVDGFQADLNLVRDGFARFDLLDDRVRFLQGPLEPTRWPTRRSSSVALLRHRARPRRRRRRRARRALRPGRRRRLRHRRRRRDAGAAAGRRGVPRRARRSPSRSSASTGRGRPGARPRPARDRAARATAAPAVAPGRRRSRRRRRRRRDRPHGRRRLLQHAARGGSARSTRCPAPTSEGIEDVDYEVIVGRERLRRRRSGSARSSCESFGPEFRYIDLGARRHAVARRTRSTAASRAARGDAPSR